MESQALFSIFLEPFETKKLPASMRRQQKQGFHHKRFAGQKAETDISVSTDVRDIGLFFLQLTSRAADAHDPHSPVPFRIPLRQNICSRHIGEQRR